MLAFASRGCEHPLASIPNRPGYLEGLVHSSLFAAVRQNRCYAHPRSPGKSDSTNRLGRECAPTSTAIAEGHQEPSQLAMPSFQHTSFTNPSKLPFHAYLTEQPFQHHPAHLIDPSDQDLDLPGIHYCAFGEWWRGGPLYLQWVDAVARLKDEEGIFSGVLSIKALDNPNKYNGV